MPTNLDFEKIMAKCKRYDWNESKQNKK